MSIPDNGSAKAGVKTLAIRLEPELHAQLSLIAQLRSSTITDEIRAAIETHIDAVKAAPELAGRADHVLEEIEREAAARRDAIATLFGTAAAEPDTSPSTRSRGKRGPSES
jgi:predicted DNA-binding protein